MIEILNMPIGTFFGYVIVFIFLFALVVFLVVTPVSIWSYIIYRLFKKKGESK